jgi:hypothetical protein
MADHDIAAPLALAKVRVSPTDVALAPSSRRRLVKGEMSGNGGESATGESAQRLAPGHCFDRERPRQAVESLSIHHASPWTRPERPRQ